MAVALGAAALTEGCVTISPLASTGNFAVNTAFTLPSSPTWSRAKLRNSGKGQLIIGVKADQPGLGYYNAAKNTYSGFDILIAQLVAAGLGFGTSQIQFTTVASENRETELENQAVDLIVASYSYTAVRARQVGFAGPYFTTTEALLVARSDTAVTGIDSITPSTPICYVNNSTAVNGINPLAPVVKNTYSECVDAVKSGAADVVYTDYALLLGFAYQDPGALKLIDTGSETQYGIGLPPGDDALQNAIDLILKSAIGNGTWRAIFNATLGPEGLKSSPPTVGHWQSS